MSGAACSPSGSRRRLCQQTSIPAPRAPSMSLGEPATNSARAGSTGSLSRASRYGSGRGLYAPAASAVTTTSNATPTRAATSCPSSSEQLVTTPIRACSLRRRSTPGASGQGSSRSGIPRRRSEALSDGTPATRAASATVSTNGRYEPPEQATRLDSSRQRVPRSSPPATSLQSGPESRSAEKRSNRTAPYPTRVLGSVPKGLRADRLCGSYAPNVLAVPEVLLRAHVAENPFADPTVGSTPEVDAHEVPRRRTAHVGRGAQMPSDSGRQASAGAVEKSRNGVGRRQRFAAARQVIEVGAVLPENDVVSRSPRVHAEEVREASLAADRASGTRGGDENHISLSKRQDLVARRRSFGPSASVVVPRKGVDRESDGGPAGDDGECAERFHGRSLDRKTEGPGPRPPCRRGRSAAPLRPPRDVGDPNVRLRALA